MRTQPRVLRLFANQAGERRPVSFEDVARELDITDQAAVDTLDRLWRQRLIVPLTTDRRRGFKWRPEPGERVRDLRFRLAPRGEERLRWWAEQKARADRWAF